MKTRTIYADDKLERAIARRTGAHKNASAAIKAMVRRFERVCLAEILAMNYTAAQWEQMASDFAAAGVLPMGIYALTDAGQVALTDALERIAAERRDGESVRDCMARIGLPPGD